MKFARNAFGLAIPPSVRALRSIPVQAPPVVDTHTVDMPMSLHPTCLDACGAMIAVGTRQGPVIVFHVGPAERSLKGNDHPSRHGGGENPQRNDGGGGGNQDCATVYRAYGSLSKGEGPISDVVLDRSKLLAAGRCSGVDGGDGRPVIRYVTRLCSTSYASFNLKVLTASGYPGEKRREEKEQAPLLYPGDINFLDPPHSLYYQLPVG